MCRELIRDFASFVFCSTAKTATAACGRVMYFSRILTSKYDDESCVGKDNLRTTGWNDLIDRFLFLFAVVSK